MTAQHGHLCPQGHGVLVERDEWVRAGVMWCPHEEHGGNGRFYRDTEVAYGKFNPDAPRVKSEWQLAQDARAATAQAEREAYEMEKREMTIQPVSVERKPRAAKPPLECTCGCGGMTKGGRFLPGHDARYHAAQKRAAAEAAPAIEQAAQEIAATIPAKRGRRSKAEAVPAPEDLPDDMLS